MTYRSLLFLVMQSSFIIIKIADSVYSSPSRSVRQINLKASTVSTLLGSGNQKELNCPVSILLLPCTSSSSHSSPMRDIYIIARGDDNILKARYDLEKRKFVAIGASSGNAKAGSISYSAYENNDAFVRPIGSNRDTDEKKSSRS
mmetsp:Transcript_27132/g.37875  ORF Transcript_27132/g.37875 Transcript_27132/m.37875 type:complete len:145 (-) Transcript_27132:162-596(-)